MGCPAVVLNWSLSTIEQSVAFTLRNFDSDSLTRLSLTVRPRLWETVPLNSLPFGGIDTETEHWREFLQQPLYSLHQHSPVKRQNVRNLQIDGSSRTFFSLDFHFAVPGTSAAHF